MLHKKLTKTSLTALAMLSAMTFSSTSSAAIAGYSQDFESLIPAENVIPNTLSADGWLVGANVYDAGGNYVYDYFAFPSPNGGPAFSGVVTGEGGGGQGANQLSIYNDYNNQGAHTSGQLVEAIVFRDIGTIEASNIGETWTFSFDAKQGNIEGATTAEAYVKVLTPGFATQANETFNTTNLGFNWTGGSIDVLIDAAFVGSTLQIGFNSVASGNQGSGVFYDNLNVGVNAVPVPAAVWLFGSGLLGLVGVARRRKA